MKDNIKLYGEYKCSAFCTIVEIKSWKMGSTIVPFDKWYEGALSLGEDVPMKFLDYLKTPDCEINYVVGQDNLAYLPKYFRELWYEGDKK